MALPDFGGAVSVDCDFTFFGVIARTSKGTVDSLITSGATDLERVLAADDGRTGERLLCHPGIDVDEVFWLRHGYGSEKEKHVTLTANTCQQKLAVLYALHK